MKLGIDTGGTFTDFILLTEQGIATYKVPSTPDDPGRAILAGLSHFFPAPDHPHSFSLPADLEIIHGTTVGTNAFLQRKGARTLLITTRGFEDVLVIGRQNRASLYDLRMERPAAIIGRDHCVGVKERILWDGSVQTPLAKSAGKRIRRICREKAVDSVAVCLLHCYANNIHEKILADGLRSLEIPVSLSSELLPEFREYERLTTTLINAYLAPIISSYINRLTEKLGTISLYIQQSNGGILPAETIGERAVHTVLSGPAGGVHGAFQLARQMGREKIITFDMGGTSTDVSLCDGQPTLTRDYRIDSYPLHIQVMDIHTVGAGGGSIASIDAGGLLHVGPQSAGADPGPVCYGIGAELTVTDANLFLGRLLADRFFGGAMPLQPERVTQKMNELGSRLGLSARETALGIIRLVNTGMSKAIRAVSLERGHDPKEFSLFSFGGASGLHCCELAGELGITEIVVPARAGILSAQGMVMADPALDASQSLLLRGEKIDREILDECFARLIADKKRELLRLCRSGRVKTERFVDIRYHGQSFELSVPYDDHFTESFHGLHEQQFGYSLPDAPLEVVSIRCTVSLVRPKQSLPQAVEQSSTQPESDGHRQVIFEGGPQLVKIYSRRHLMSGHRLSGPVLIVDDYTTILVPAHFHLTVDHLLNLLIRPN
ncbi:MAG: hydantoinase/oxoprolinase family protein [Proteobacteria bacterium]|nr:hydantoinase/oxoprolinase family protein [Pseudomonadota bacterium]MBU0965978.1 hydantoinase/oxoprolinase family protein [Pseudomonadota bacterium]